ncbi:restriction endonuclease subunit S [Roseibium sediminis]|uniref:restriction endonuclease subunit S n=1 Tax=Roseibium sediminis TaxID=1775174 RepID=UPI001375E1D2|nr:restriction endonuclease subunit S [Roseibium sediminis]
MNAYTGALRYFGRIRNGSTPASGEAEYWGGNVKWATPEDLGKLNSDRISTTKRMVTEKAVEENNLSVLPVGSVLISTRAPIGHMAITEEPMAFNQGCRGIIPGSRAHGPFLYYLLKSRAPELNAMANGTTFVELSRDELAAVWVEFPPLETQQKIARFLDEKTAKIDGLIEKKRALLERLAEKRQALITRAVTKGLNPDAPMKPSGIDWLGDIPAHWTLCSLGQQIKLQRGVDITKNDRVNGPYPVISSGGIDYYNETALCTGPGVLVGRKGSAGKLHYTETNYWPHDTTLYVKEFRGNQPRFVWYLLHTLDLESFDSGSANPTVNRNRVHPMKTVWPNISEQEKISIFLDRELDKYHIIENKISKSARFLEEYRSALITAAVTGQIEGLQ